MAAASLAGRSFAEPARRRPCRERLAPGPLHRIDQDRSAKISSAAKRRKTGEKIGLKFSNFRTDGFLLHPCNPCNLTKDFSQQVRPCPLSLPLWFQNLLSRWGSPIQRPSHTLLFADSRAFLRLKFFNPNSPIRHSPAPPGFGEVTEFIRSAHSSQSFLSEHTSPQTTPSRTIPR